MTLVLWCAVPRAWAAPACAEPVARVASVQGAVELRRGAADWVRVAPEQPLCAGDVVRVGERSRAALLMRNETSLRLDQHTSVTLQAPEAPGGTLIEQLRGIVNVITRTPKPFRLTTPFVNANVEGTEFLVKVGTADASVLVYEGRVVASNPAGEVALGAGEMASGGANTQPVRSLAVRPAEAVHWAVHYPTVRPAAGTELPAVREALALRDAGRVAEAVARLDAVPAQERSGAWRLQRAALLLDVGRVDEAAPELAAIDAGPAYAEALALQAVVALVHNDAPRARALAERAVAADGRAAAPQLAMSYVQQSRFALDDAAAHARAAVALDPGNALGWARLAELYLYAGDAAAARAAALRAVEAGPGLSRAHTAFGFTLLGHFDTATARAAFERAQQLDQGDPLPRMGLGLAQIHEGDLVAGRQSIQIAVSLDPENALLRSYLGKAYAQERRGHHAETQFALAKARDPNDPTPWFYEAMHKLLTHRPVEALDDITRSIALNDRRAVFRSRLLLDEDLAVRGAGLARVYDALGFGRLALTEAAKALAVDPGNAAPHRFLADVYRSLDRHEAASASEELQALLLQPVQATPTRPPHRSAPVMGLIDDSVLGQPDDHTRLFDERGASGRIDLAAGSRGLWSLGVDTSYAAERWALSAGLFRYHSDGFRSNSDITHHIENVLLQAAPDPSLNLQLELARRSTRAGELQQVFDPADRQPGQRNETQQRVGRLGVAWRPGAGHLWLLSRQDVELEDRRLLSSTPLTEVFGGSDAPGHMTELQYQWRTARSTVLLGAGNAQVRHRIDVRVVLADEVGLCPAAAPCVSSAVDPTHERQAYAYWLHRPSAAWSTTLGLSREHREAQGADIRRWHHKLGAIWSPSDGFAMRLASFRTLKRGFGADRTLEPTQVAGFNQFFDDPSSTRAEVLAAATDLTMRPDLRLTLSVQRRKLMGAPGLQGGQWHPGESMSERLLHAQVFWTPAPRVAVRAGVEQDRFGRIPVRAQMDTPTLLRTTSVPLAARYFWPGGRFAELAVTSVRQTVERQPDARQATGRERFTLVDLTLGMQVPGRPVTVSLTAKNLLGERFRFQDDSFRSGELRLGRYLPARSVVLATQMSF
ncbi:FecR domain-containing protein [Aquincola sp. MAHUQ-54]|uniref:FecR domain-containing protein n=1 Tax=Aquincola agrisoli TaxID=3119538 RepID=A0AAW9QIH3_9BURK